jgi:hypothetical protein
LLIIGVVFGAAVMVNDALLDTALPVLTVTVAVPWEAIRLAAIEAVT